MPNRDALWVDETGKTIPVVLDEQGNRVDIPAPAPEPFGGKGDHDGDGKPGGAKKPKKPKKS